VAEEPWREFGVAVGALADREVAAPALVALAADDGEGHDDPVADLELARFSRPTSTTSPMNSWPMMSPDFMPGMKPSWRCRSEPQIAQVVTLMIASLGSSICGVGDGLAADVVLAVPGERAHG
jgi:hypothetical protein